MIFAVLLLVASYVFLVFVIVRCADGRIGINSIAGIRTPTIMTDEQTWLAGHKAARNPSLAGTIGAIVLTIVAVFLPNLESQSLAIILGCLLLLAGILYGTVKGTKAARKILANQ
ncbi:MULTISPECIES: SdpI family protein [Glutamicibacter]|uniref:Hypothetical membrane protein n=1 Tax=Glutamicibacter arilaitensis (strain DSM 16368 / CIP 108037 / IAM 15318 / JCM 13566 / NCIMB 14258 / Re117) TaxID=861360 RepID=A0ABP1U155_GLUAR|nr:MULTISPECIES: SdpI family protein [Glutamicibacter]CBT75103.1 hypothetical membrane protein [Glutamicibacter arilaitensis Re117]HCH47253.1 hypothetical protein [Glutamicibacter sp.]